MTYLNHFNLKEKPFKLNPDPRFMWFGEAHKEAWTSLHLGILERRGFILLVGDVGTGKTTVINKLLQGLDKSTLVAQICDPGLDQLDFFKFLAGQFGLETGFQTKGAFLIELNLLLHRAYENGKNVVVIVDEAQRLSDEMLEEIRLLSNIERADEKLINIVLVGQNELRQKLSKEVNRALRQRITTFYTIGPLAGSEVEDFIRFRLKVAGSEEKIFTDRAVRLITNYSRGNPRLINVICDQALLTAFVEEKRRVDEKILQQCIEALQFSFPRAASTGGGPDADAGKGAPAPVAQQDRSPEKIPDLQRTIDADPSPSPRPRSWTRFLVTGLAVAVSGLLILGAVYRYHLRLPERWGARSASSRDIYPIRSSPSEEKLPTPPASPEGKAAPSRNLPVPTIAGQADEALPTTGSGSTQTVQAPGLDGSSGPAGEDPFHPVPADAAAPGPEQPPAEAPPDNGNAAPAPPSFSVEKTVIHFPYNSDQISDDAAGQLNRLAETIKSRPGARLVISGYTDTLGEKAYNLKVSQFRAEAIKSYLVGQGVGADRITAIGRGPANPVAPDDTYHGRSQNRRVEVEMVVSD